MASSKPKVRVLATGGSIASLGPHRLDYTVYPELGRHMTIQESLARIPEVSRFAAMESEDIRSVGSTAIGPSDWLELTRRINKTFEEDPSVAGVVVSHGTATLEETAFFLHLTVKSTRPVVVTAAMRPPTSLSTDADANLLDAIRVAACPEASGMGVLTVLNTEIHSARETTKADTFRVQTFKPDELGYLGYADPDGEVVFYRAPLRKHTTATPFDVTGLDTVPRVDIVYTYAGADGLLVDVVRRNRSDGLVVAGFGGGHYPDRRRRCRSPCRKGRYRRGDGVPSFGRACDDDPCKRGEGLHSSRQPPSTQGPDPADAGPDPQPRPPRAPADVLGVLTT